VPGSVEGYVGGGGGWCPEWLGTGRMRPREALRDADDQGVLISLDTSAFHSYEKDKGKKTKQESTAMI
jgi:hypothetical protein